MGLHIDDQHILHVTWMHIDQSQWNTVILEVLII